MCFFWIVCVHLNYYAESSLADQGEGGGTNAYFDMVEREPHLLNEPKTN